MAAQPREVDYAFLLSPDGMPSRKLAARIEEAMKGKHLRLATWWRDSAPGPISVEIVDQIRDAQVVFADLRGKNPNVFFEVGIAQALGRHVICSAKLRQFHSICKTSGRSKWKVARTIPFEHPEMLVDAIQQAVDETKRRKPVNAVQVSNLLRENTELKSRLESTIGARPSSGEENLSTAPMGPAWRDLALAGLLPLLNRQDLAPSAQVVHLVYGVGRVIEHTPLTDNPMSVTIAFSNSNALLSLPDSRLFLAELRPSDRDTPASHQTADD